MLTNDEYDGVVYYYSTVKFEEKNHDAYLSFEYHIMDNPTGKELDGDVDFGNYIGDVLVDIIEEGMKLDTSGKDSINTSP